MESDTPRTDARFWEREKQGCGFDPEFARQLERELAAAKADSTSWEEVGKGLRRELGDSRKNNARLIQLEATLRQNYERSLQAIAEIDEQNARLRSALETAKNAYCAAVGVGPFGCPMLDIIDKALSGKGGKEGVKHDRETDFAGVVEGARV